MRDIPQIDNGKKPLQPLNIVHFMWLPSSTPYGNLFLKGMNIVRRIDRVNLEIDRVFKSYVTPSKEDINNLQQDLLEHQFYAEQVVYWMRKTADELMSLAYVIDEWNRTGEWPVSVKVESFTDLKKSHSNELQQLFSPHYAFLTTLHEMSNAFKHSFINTDMTVVGSEYPVVFALNLKVDKQSKRPQSYFYSVNFAEMVEAFSSLYKQVIATIQQWANLGKAKNEQNTT